jgi:hypothetical protein
MITFKQFITENKSNILYRRVSDSIAKLLRDGKSVPNKKKFVSFAKDRKYLKDEFGKTTVVLNTVDLKNVKVIPIQYDLSWFTQSPMHRELLLYVTARDEDDWLEEFDNDIDAIDDELETIYGEEAEVVLMGLKEFDPAIFKVE